MRINNKQLPLKYIIVSVVLIVGLAGAFAWGYVSQQDSTNNDSDQETSIVEPAPTQLSDEEAAAKQKFIEEQEKEPSKTDSDSLTSGNQTSTPAKLELSASNNGGSVTVMSRLSGIGDGSCNLRATNGNQSYTEEADVIYQPTYSTCAGFSVPVSELGAGNWQITVQATSIDGVKAQATTTLGVN